MAARIDRVYLAWQFHGNGNRLREIITVAISCFASSAECCGTLYAHIVSQRGRKRKRVSSHCANNNEIDTYNESRVKLTTDHQSRELGNSPVSMYIRSLAILHRVGYL